MTRTDQHRPADLVTEDYDLVLVFDTDPPEFFGDPSDGIGSPALEAYQRLLEQHRDDTARLERLVADSPLADRGLTQCHHCGARLRYAAIMHHQPTGQHIVVGETCLDNRFTLATAEFQKLRKAAALAAAERRIVKAATAFIATLDGDVAEALHREADLSRWQLDSWATSTVQDIRRKLWRYGDISERQVAFVTKLLDEGPKKAAERAAQDTEVKVPAPEGRHAIEGEVVSAKWHDNDYGSTLKLTVKVITDEGVWLGWVTCPTAINPGRGDRVRLTATWTRSDRDEHFAFGKRPTKAEVL